MTQRRKVVSVLAGVCLATACTTEFAASRDAPTTAPEPSSGRTPAMNGPHLPSEVLAGADPEVAKELEWTWVSSGTRARLASVGLVESSPAVASGVPDLGEAARFSVHAPAGDARAVVLFFLDASAQRAASEPLRRAELRSASNGAFLVVLSPAGPDMASRADEILQAVAGRE